MELEQILKLIDASVEKRADRFFTGRRRNEAYAYRRTRKRIQSGTADRRAGYTVRLYAGITGRKPSGVSEERTQSMTTGNPAAMDGYSFTAAGGEYQTDTQKNEKQAEGTVVASPLVGIFYSAPSPEDEPFVTVGDTVKKGQTLGVIEAMKLMNEIESECDGIVKEVLVENGEMVEFGQPLFIVGVVKMP